ncbi:DUF948 domain-containing protein [Paenibacillus sp. TAB 01]|uniref:DUF948 domain-containing protein n=1 Tax=Paenibacillus sp. TAB 01 TaxID=3368988 RepID=UPI00375231B0
MIIQISVALIAVAFVVLVAFLIVTLRSMSELLKQTNTTIRELQGEIKGISKEASHLLQHTNQVTVDVLDKLHSLDPTFDSVKQVGEVVEDITSSVKQASTAVAKTIQAKVKEEKNLPLNNRIAQAITFAPLVVDVWQQIKHRRMMASASAAAAPKGSSV